MLIVKILDGDVFSIKNSIREFVDPIAQNYATSSVVDRLVCNGVQVSEYIEIDVGIRLRMFLCKIGYVAQSRVDAIVVFSFTAMARPIVGKWDSEARR